jgi:hypothetical protein
MKGVTRKERQATNTKEGKGWKGKERKGKEITEQN